MNCAGAIGSPKENRKREKEKEGRLNGVWGVFYSITLYYLSRLSVFIAK